MVAAQPDRPQGAVTVMYLSWKDFQGYMDEFRRDIQKKFDEHTAEHRSEKDQNKSFRIAVWAAAASTASGVIASIALIVSHLH